MPDTIKDRLRSLEMHKPCRVLFCVIQSDKLVIQRALQFVQMDPEHSTITGLSEIYILLVRDRRLDERAAPILSFPATILRLHAKFYLATQHRNCVLKNIGIGRVYLQRIIQVSQGNKIGQVIKMELFVDFLDLFLDIINRILFYLIRVS